MSSIIGTSTSTSTSTSTTAVPRPKAMALTILIDWANLDKADGVATTNVNSVYHPCWLCIHFGPAPSALPHHQIQHAQAVGQWQFTMNIYSAGITPVVKKQNEEPIPKERRALLWFNTQPFEKYRYAVVMAHCRFPTALMPRVIAFHTDRAESDTNALVWVRKKTTQKRYKEDSYLKVVRSHLYHLHFTFPDGDLINQYIAQGWGFVASLHTFKRKRGHISTAPSRAVTQIRAGWLDVVEADPDADELEMARVAVLQNEKDEKDAQEAEAFHKITASTSSTSSSTSTSSQITAKRTYSNSGMGSATSTSSSSSSSSSSGSTEIEGRPNKKRAIEEDTRSKEQAAAEWNQSELDALVFAGGSTGRDLPDYATMPASYTPTIDLGPCVDTFFDAPAASSGASASFVLPSDRELLSLFRALENKAKSVATDSNSKLRDAAQRLTKFLSASGQLDGWRHVERYMVSPDMYSRKARVEQKNTENNNKKQEQGMIDGLIDKSVELLKNVMIRAKWVLEIEKRHAEASKQQSDGKTLERVLGVLLKDTKWMTESASFLKNAEAQVAELINQNPGAFAKFRELQVRGVQWPHSLHLRRQIERAGFVFRPMMIKRDRCVCDDCGVEVYGWRPWHNPWLFHDWSKRHRIMPPAGTPVRLTTTTQ